MARDALKSQVLGDLPAPPAPRRGPLSSKGSEPMKTGGLIEYGNSLWPSGIWTVLLGGDSRAAERIVVGH